MQLQSDKSHRFEEIKTQFRAREGYYRLMNSPDYSQRSQRAMAFSTGTTNSNSSTASNEKTCIKISLVTINDCSTDQVPPSLNRRRAPGENQNLESRHTNPSSAFTVMAGGRTHRRSRGARDKKICFNVGRELFVYNYDGVRTGPDASNPIYKRSYKGSSPTCHDFNQATASSKSISLLVGFSHGQVQLINLNGSEDQDCCKEFNVDRLIDKTRVTCVKWLPSSPSLFLVAHASGQLYLYKDDLPCGPAAPIYQLFKQSEGVTVYTCKTKTTRNPIYKWTVGAQAVDVGSASNLLGSSSSLNSIENESCSLNEFVFSPCAKYLACVSQDGFLRVYCYDTMELIGRARSYYGGLSCVCWSPDGKYVVTGGEDDLITVWSFVERRVVARGTGHKSWVSVVAFDSFYTGYDLKDTDVDNDDDDEDEDDKEVDERDLEGEGDEDDEDDIRGSRTRRALRDTDDETRSPSIQRKYNTKNSHYSPNANRNSVDETSLPTLKSYRFGSVGQDTQLCLWDLNDDLLKQPIARSKINTISGAMSSVNLSSCGGASSLTVINNDRDSSLTNQQQKLSENNSNIPINCTEMSCGITGTTVSDIVNSSKNIAQTPTTSTTSQTTAATTTTYLSSKGSSFTKTFSLVGKRDKRNSSHRSIGKGTHAKNNQNIFQGSPSRLVDDPTKLLGSPICPRMNEVPLLEPSVCKKISFERLTSLIFCKGGFITSCQDGYVFSWARPSRKPMRVSPGQSNEELRVIDVGTSSAV